MVLSEWLPLFISKHAFSEREDIELTRQVLRKMRRLIGFGKI